MATRKLEGIRLAQLLLAGCAIVCFVSNTRKRSR